MKIMKRSLLWLLTAAVPVVIAACYGVMTNYKKVQVVNSVDKAGIVGIQVTCDMNAEEDGGSAVEDAGEVSGTFITDADGKAIIEYSIACNSLTFTDIDGDDNGGQFATKTIDFVASDEDEVVELNPSTN